MTTGVISGGWGYVWAVYGLTWAVMLAYGGMLLLRARPHVLAALADSPDAPGGGR